MNSHHIKNIPENDKEMYNRIGEKIAFIFKIDRDI